MTKLKSLPTVRVCVSYVNKGMVTRIFGNNHAAPVVREGIVPPVKGEILLRKAITLFNLNLNEILFLR